MIIHLNVMLVWYPNTFSSYKFRLRSSICISSHSFLFSSYESYNAVSSFSFF